jgi:hypothetical protein
MDMEEARGDEDNKIDPPGKLKHSEWVRLELQLINYLQNMLGRKSSIPLHCTIRKDLPAGHVFANHAKTLIHECPLQGLVYDEGTRKVFVGVTKQSLSDTHNWDWIKRLKQPRSGWDRCHGPSQDPFRGSCRGREAHWCARHLCYGAAPLH